MRGLTPTEAYLLELASGPHEVQVPWDRFNEGAQSLAAAGRAILRRDDGGWYLDTTPIGREALRLHKAGIR